MNFVRWELTKRLKYDKLRENDISALTARGGYMSVQTSKTILKVFGILDIIGGVLGLIGGLILLAGGGLIAAAGGSGDEAAVGALAGILGVIALIASVITLIQGICSINAAKDTSKIMPAWVFAIIGMKPYLLHLSLLLLSTPLFYWERSIFLS